MMKAAICHSSKSRDQGRIYSISSWRLAFTALYLILAFQVLLLSNASKAEASQAPLQLASFADIIEPLMPAVVNIYTVQYNSQQSSYSSFLPEFLPLDSFDDFLKKYNLPFSIKDLSFNPESMSLGSGFIIDESGLIVTNNHVVEGSDEIHIKLSDNTELPARIVGKDAKTDLVLLKIDYDKKLPFVKFADSGATRVGDIVIAIGNPLGFGGTVTTGIISSKGRDLGIDQDELVDDFLQTDAAINAGNSGGPLFNIHGDVIGVNTSVPAIGDGTNIGIGFAIPSNTVQTIIAELKKNGKITRGKLDISIQEINKELADALGLDSVTGVLVVDVAIGGAGQKAGLKRGDLIMQFDGKKVANLRKLQLFVAESHIGQKIKLGIMREGKNLEFETEIFDSETAADKSPNVDLMAGPLVEKNGITFSDLSPALTAKFGLDPKIKGVMVVKIPKEEINFDLKIGDVIISINQQVVLSTKQFESVYDSAKPSDKKSLILLVNRKETKMFVALPMIENK